MVTKTKVKTECAWNEKCIDVDGVKCLSCLNNEKRSYYRQEYPSYPVYPTNPWPWDYWEPYKITYTDPYYGTTCESETSISYYSPVN